MKDMVININTKVVSDIHSRPVERAVRNLERDLGKACDKTCVEKQGAEIILRFSLEQQSECFRLFCENGSLVIEAGDDLGFIYGIYKVSRSVLGINDYWFWNDQKIVPRQEYVLQADYDYQSEPYRIKYRGWFINDEVLLHTWSVNRRKEEPWEMALEALMRQGGNMVIPGTDKNSGKYRGLASRMGLFVTHHHAEPLGAQMFSRAYPGLKPSFAEYPDKFRKLWQEGIEAQKGMKVIWNLGFRGQGDCPFWVNDPQYQTEESRGELMSRLIRMQYDMVKAADKDAACCTNLYGETMELYKEGLLKLPEDVIKIWADNGYGKMVTRRQDNHNPRVYSLPSANTGGRHGIYYHVSFYDLQAANHITMLPNSPEFVKKELTEAIRHGADNFWIINCSNVKPHVYFLDLISEFWKNGDIDTEAHRMAYVKRYYGERNAGRVAECFKEYHRHTVSYGEHEDEHAGEQYANHPVRILISQYMKNRESCARELLWLGESGSLRGQIGRYKAHCEKAAEGYGRYETLCRRTEAELDEERELFRDSLLLQERIHCGCFHGALLVCKSLLAALDEEYMEAFYLAGKARKCYLQADSAMRSREHGKWHGFYQNECLTDVKQTAWVLEGLMSFLRCLGDGPHYFGWQREFLYSEEDRRVMLILNMENHLRDQELFELMEEKWDR